MIENAFAALAMIETYGMTMDGNFKAPAQKAVDYVLGARTPSGVWGVWAKSSNEDITATAWNMMVLKSAIMAALLVPKESCPDAQQWLNTVSWGEQRGYFGNSPDGSLLSTAAGNMAWLYAGSSVERARLDEGCAFLETRPPSWEGKNMRYWYFGTLTMFVAGGERWEKWKEALHGALPPVQRRGGCVDGSWDSEGDPYLQGGRIEATALGMLCLRTYYQYNLFQKRE
jgi:hypothetical protein